VAFVAIKGDRIMLAQREEYSDEPEWMQDVYFLDTIATILDSIFLLFTAIIAVVRQKFRL
jgi:hypothetical protein